MLVAVIASNLAARVRTQAIVARQRAATTEDLYHFSRKLAGIVTLDDLLWATAYQMAHMLGLHVVLLLPEGEELAVRAGYPPEDTLDEADLAAAKWASSRASEAGRGADTLPGARRLFLPHAHRRAAWWRSSAWIASRTGPLLTPDQRRLLDALADQAALAIERHQAGRRHGPGPAGGGNRAAALGAADLDHPRSAHAAGLHPGIGAPACKAYRDQLDDAEQDELLGTIQEEAERLNHFIANLLDMTRLESGALAPNLEADRSGRRGRQRAAPRAELLGAASRGAGAGARPAAAAGWTWCCSSRCCSICWTMPPNMRRPARR